jgi:hypothetical protein
MARGLQTWDIYDSDMRFYDPHLRLHLRSRRQYYWGTVGLRWVLKFGFAHARFHVLRVHQEKTTKPNGTEGDENKTGPGELDDGMLRVYFEFSGVSRWRWHTLLMLGYSPQNILEQQLSVYEGISVYAFNQKGILHAHWIERLIPRPTLWPLVWGPRFWGLGVPGTVKEWRAGWTYKKNH